MPICWHRSLKKASESNEAAIAKDPPAKRRTGLTPRCKLLGPSEAQLSPCQSRRKRAEASDGITHSSNCALH
eukprot:3462723-Alexandrium_andersonii.AAC.1